MNMCKSEKRWLALLFIAAIVVTPLYAEGQKEEAAKKPQIITAFLESGGAGTAATGAVDSFNETYPEYKIEVIRVSNTDQLRLTLNELVNQVGAYDVFGFNLAWYGMGGQFLEDLTPYMKKHGPSWNEFLPGMKQLGMHEGKVFGLPYRTGVTLMFANNELLEQAGVKTPKTWDEFEAALEKCDRDTDGDGVKDIFGTSLELGLPSNVTGSTSDRFYGRGGNWLKDENTAQAFDSKHGRLLTEIFTYYKYLTDKYLVPKSSLIDTAWETLAHFQEGRVAMSFIYSNRSPHIEDPSKSKVVDKVSYVPIPRTSDGWYPVGAWVLSFPNYLSQKRKDAAYKFISHAFTREANLRMALEYANGPTIKSVLESKEFVDFFPATAGVKEAMPYTKFPLLSLIPNRGEFDNAISDESHAVVTGRKTPEEGARSVFKRLEEIVKTKK